MTREMNKPDWHYEWTLRHKGTKAIRENELNALLPYNPIVFRELDDWIKPFFDNCCRMEKLK